MDGYLRCGLNEVGIELPDYVLEKELSYLDELLRWTKKINLTSISNRKEAIEKHLIDSLLALRYLDSSKTVLDMGSGGGLPGIPLAIANQRLEITSVDSVGKKVNFQRHIKRKLQLDNIHIVQTRIENLSDADSANKFDCVVSRAFSSLATIIEYSSQLVNPGGMVVSMKGPEGCGEVEEIETLLQQCGFGKMTAEKYLLPYSKGERYLFISHKNQTNQN